VTRALGLTVYSCEPDETDLFNQLSPQFGVIPTTTSAAVSETSIVSVTGNRCVSVGHKSEISASMLRALKHTGVEYISTRSIGLNHIDLRAAAHLGITVENAAYAPDGVADYTVMLILMAIRNAKETVSSANNYDFRLRSVRGKELRDLTVGVVGVGNIGEAVIRRLHGFGCRVLASNNSCQASAAAEFVSLDELLLESDVVTLHLPLNAETHHLVGRREIETMKPGAYLINTGRGSLVDTDALIGALEDGRLGGAALDVLEGEEGLFYFDCTNRPIDNRHLPALQRLPNVIITPHTAYYTRRALYDTVEQTLIKCRNFERSRAHD
jgi:D-specific alpha-keto acid dehydrogenase